MHREVLKHANLLKKYSNNLVYDYTEYPTKGVWKDDFGHIEYVEALQNWLVEEKNALLYVHTPFCEQLCYFCLCSKEITGDYDKVKRYLYEYLFKEIDLLKKQLDISKKKLNIREIYFGGGSPTYYKEAEFLALTKKLAEIVDFEKVDTFTVETDPRRVTREKLHFYADNGVNRLSFGVQDFAPEVQQEINRIQPPELLEELLTSDVRARFKAVNFDILVGLPMQTPSSMRTTIQRVVEISPDEVQPLYVHYKPGTRSYMTKMVKNVLMPDFYDRKMLYAEVIDELLHGGYIRAGYENFAKPSDVLATAMDKKKATYNSLGTTSGENINFVSIGSSAHGVFGKYYFQNYYERNLYEKSLDSDEFPIYRGYELTDNDLIRRDLIKTFRIYDSVEKKMFSDRWGIIFDEFFAEDLDRLSPFLADGLAENTPTHLKLTPLGREFTPRFCEVFDSYSKRDLYRKDVPLNFSQPLRVLN